MEGFINASGLVTRMLMSALSDSNATISAGMHSLIEDGRRRRGHPFGGMLPKSHPIAVLPKTQNEYSLNKSVASTGSSAASPSAASPPASPARQAAVFRSQDHASQSTSSRAVSPTIRR